MACHCQRTGLSLPLHRKPLRRQMGLGPSQPVSPALPSTRGPQLKVWLNEEMLFPLLIRARAVLRVPREAGRLLWQLRVRVPLLSWPGTTGRRHKGHCWYPSPPEGPGRGQMGMNATTNLSVGEPTGTEEIRSDFIHSSLRQGRKEGGLQAE